MALNYQHLHYFWVAARAGSVTGAARSLRLAPSTVSAQIKELEGSLGQALFRRRGRGLVLTEAGQVVLGHADAIFGLGRELEDILAGRRDAEHPVWLRVGVASGLPRLLVWRLLAPALTLDGVPVHLVCVGDRPSRLLDALALHRVDLVLSDGPVAPVSGPPVHCMPLGASGLTWFGTPELAASLRGPHPQRLQGAPVLLPEGDAALRPALDAWLVRHGLRVRVVGEFGDSALMKAFGEGGAGLFPAPTIVADHVVARHGVVALGELDGVVERYYGVTPHGPGSLGVVRQVLERAGHLLVASTG